MPEAGLKELLEAGVHFGHQTRRWNPNMRRYIFGELDGIHIIDLVQTEALLENARRFAGELASGGGTVLFVGTKKQARGPVEDWANRCKMPYVNQRWLGGLLTNFNTMSAQDRAPARAHRVARGGQARAAADQGADGHAGGTRQARIQPRRGPRHGAPARRGLRHRPQNRGDRGARGGPPADPDHRPGRHQLRSDPDRLCDPRQRRRDPLLRAGDRHDRQCGRRGRQLLEGQRGAPYRRGNGAAKEGRGRAQEARGRRESADRRGGGCSESRGGGAGCQAGRGGAGCCQGSCSQCSGSGTGGSDCSPDRTGCGSCRGAGGLVLAGCGRGPQPHATRRGSG